MYLLLADLSITMIDKWKQVANFFFWQDDPRFHEYNVPDIVKAFLQAAYDEVWISINQ